MKHKKEWLIAAIVIMGFTLMGFFVVLTLVSYSLRDKMELATPGSKIAVIEVNGVITSAKSTVRQLKRFGKDATVKGIVLRIDSPGGGVAASQEIYEHVRRVKQSGKPIVTSMGTVAASGGYYIALGTQTIMANPGTTTGSIGVIAEIPNFRKLMEKIGISFEIIKSGKFKDTGSPYREMTREERGYLQDWVDSSYEQFVQAVMTERSLPEAKVRGIADGRVFTGQQARELALIDTLGTFDDAVRLAADLSGIEGEPRIVRETQRKVTLFDILSGDVVAFLQDLLGTWPRVKYLLAF